MQKAATNSTLELWFHNYESLGREVCHLRERWKQLEIAIDFSTTWTLSRVNLTEFYTLSHTISDGPEDILSYACSCVGRCEALLLLPNNSLGRGMNSPIVLKWIHKRVFVENVPSTTQKRENFCAHWGGNGDCLPALWCTTFTIMILHWVDVCGILPCSSGAVLSSQTTHSLRKLRQIGWKEHIFMKLNESRKLPLNAAKLNEILWWKLTRKRFFFN